MLHVGKITLFRSSILIQPEKFVSIFISKLFSVRIAKLLTCCFWRVNLFIIFSISLCLKHYFTMTVSLSWKRPVNSFKSSNLPLCNYNSVVAWLSTCKVQFIWSTFAIYFRMRWITPTTAYCCLLSLRWHRCKYLHFFSMNFTVKI